jgi:hypothetical protein
MRKTTLPSADSSNLPPRTASTPSRRRHHWRWRVPRYTSSLATGCAPPPPHSHPVPGNRAQPGHSTPAGEDVLSSRRNPHGELPRHPTFTCHGETLHRRYVAQAARRRSQQPLESTAVDEDVLSSHRDPHGELPRCPTFSLATGRPRTVSPLRRLCAAGRNSPSSQPQRTDGRDKIEDKAANVFQKPLKGQTNPI